MRILVPTIQHTGTRFTEDLFIKKGFHSKSFIEAPEGRTLHIGHISKGQREAILSLIKDLVTVIPLRHPYLVSESWKRRGKDLNELVDNYKILTELDYYNPFYLPIDTPNKNYYLNKISDFLNINLITEWEVKNSIHSTYSLHWTDIKPDPIIEKLVEETRLLDRFY